MSYWKGQSRLNTKLIVSMIGIVMAAWSVCAGEVKMAWAKTGPYQATPSGNLRCALSSFSPASAYTATLRVAAISGWINAHGPADLGIGEPVFQGARCVGALLAQRLNITSVRITAFTNAPRVREHQSVPVLHGGLMLALLGLSLAGIALFRRG
jgi:hypothetical protein